MVILNLNSQISNIYFYIFKITQIFKKYAGSTVATRSSSLYCDNMLEKKAQWIRMCHNICINPCTAELCVSIFHSFEAGIANAIFSCFK